jgi:lysophospholipase L1-like esterase
VIGATGPQGPTGATGATGPALDLTSGPVRSTAGTSSIADGALSIAKTSGLQSAINEIKPIKIIGCVGDSITDQSSVPSFFRANGWAANMMSNLLPRIQLVGKSSGDYEFGVSGAKAVDFLTGGTQREIWLQAIASPADTLMICLGANDCASSPVAATISAAILTLWTEAQAAGKTVVGMDITSCHASHPAAATYKAAQTAVNLTISEEARTRGMIYVDWARTCDIANDGYTDSPYLYDTLVHPNITGGAVLGLYAASVIEPFLPRGPVLAVPPSSSDRWITPNPYALGTPGSPMTATGWTPQIIGGVGTITANLIDGGNSNVGNWQELVVAGVNTANVLLSSPTNYGRVYQRNNTAAVVAGAKYRGYCEYEIADAGTIYLIESSVTMESAPRVYGMYADGGLASVSIITPATRGILLTPEYTATTTGTTDTFHFINIMGNGTVRIRRAGVFRSN